MKKLSVIEAKFKRLNINTNFTKLFNELDDIQKGIIIEETNFIDEEKPAFAFFYNTNYWWSVTNHRLIIYQDTIITNIFFEEIKNVELKEIFEEEIRKEDCEVINIILFNKSEVKLKVEKNTWFSVYNMFLFLCSF